MRKQVKSSREAENSKKHIFTVHKDQCQGGTADGARNAFPGARKKTTQSCVKHNKLESNFVDNDVEIKILYPRRWVDWAILLQQIKLIDDSFENEYDLCLHC